MHEAAHRSGACVFVDPKRALVYWRSFGRRLYRILRSYSSQMGPRGHYAGVLNTGAALYLITDHRGWFDRPLWAVAVIVFGLAVLAVGFVLDRRERRRGKGEAM